MNRFLAAAALGAVAFSANAAAQSRPDISPEATQAAVRYALPHLVSGTRAACAPKLSATGFLARNGDALVTRYAQGSDAAWPAARAAFMKLSASDTSGMAKMFGNMPDAALKPFVDATIPTLIATKLNLDDCADIERGLALVAPLPPENVAKLAAFLVEMSERKGKPSTRAKPAK